MNELLGDVTSGFGDQRLRLLRSGLEHLGIGAAGRRDEQLPKPFGESVEHPLGREPLPQEIRGRLQRARDVARADRRHRLADPILGCDAEHPLEQRCIDSVVGCRDESFQKTQAVAHRSIGESRHPRDRRVLRFDRLRREDVSKMIRDPRDRDGPEVEPLAATLDRGQHLVGFGRAQDELHVRRRLLHRLQQSVEGGGREHVDLVDDVDLVRGPGRKHAGVGDQVPRVLDAVVARAVDLDDVDVVTPKHRSLIERLVGAVQAAGEDAGHRRLADAAGAAEEIGVRRPIPIDRLLERVRDRLLTHHLAEGLGAIPSGQHLVPGVGRGLAGIV